VRVFSAFPIIGFLSHLISLVKKILVFFASENDIPGSCLLKNAEFALHNNVCSVHRGEVQAQRRQAIGDERRPTP